MCKLLCTLCITKQHNFFPPKKLNKLLIFTKCESTSLFWKTNKKNQQRIEQRNPTVYVDSYLACYFKHLNSISLFSMRQTTKILRWLYEAHEHTRTARIKTTNTFIDLFNEMAAWLYFCRCTTWCLPYGSAVCTICFVGTDALVCITVPFCMCVRAYVVHILNIFAYTEMYVKFFCWDRSKDKNCEERQLTIKPSSFFFSLCVCTHMVE